MHDRCETKYQPHRIAQTLSTSANMNSGPRELVRLVPASAGASGGESITIVVIEKRLLIRECLTRCLRISGYAVVCFPDIGNWIETGDHLLTSLIVLCVAGKPNNPETLQDISRLSQQNKPPPMVLLSDEEDPDQIADAIGRGARGYIPTSVPLQAAIEVLRLVGAGGIFVPASGLAARPANDGIAASPQNGDSLFTARQAAVAEALRRGKANKVIASELNMRESTVKVHVRNIMKKLNARNRTEVAVMANALMRDAAAD
jgi:DNA-binding NarL/FixJ family response regulator